MRLRCFGAAMTSSSSSRRVGIVVIGSSLARRDAPFLPPRRDRPPSFGFGGRVGESRSASCCSQLVAATEQQTAPAFTLSPAVHSPSSTHRTFVSTAPSLARDSNPTASASSVNPPRRPLNPAVTPVWPLSSSRLQLFVVSMRKS